MTIDCLPVTGSASLPLMIAAVALIGAGVAALVISRTARRAPRVMAVLLALGLCTGGTAVGISGDAPVARAATSDDGCSEQVATTGPGGLPAVVPEPTSDSDPAPSASAEPGPAVPDLAVEFPAQGIPAPPMGGGIPNRSVNLEVAPYSQQHIMEITNVSDIDSVDPIVLFIPEQASGYWATTAVLEADGSASAEVTTSAVAGGVRVEIDAPLGSGQTWVHQVVLRYDPLAWDRTFVEAPDGTWSATVRPASTLVVQISEETADARPGNNTASLEIPAYGYAIVAP